MIKLKNLKSFIFLLVITANVFANLNKQTDDYIKAYKNHADQINILERTTKLYQLKTSLQKAKLECQKFGGCQSRSIYTPIQTKTTSDKQKAKDKELVAILNKPLPVIASILDNSVNFNGDAKLYRVNNLVYGVWLIKAISPTQVSVKNKDTNEVSIIYFYWD